MATLGGTHEVAEALKDGLPDEFRNFDHPAVGEEIRQVAAD